MRVSRVLELRLIEAVRQRLLLLAFLLLAVGVVLSFVFVAGGGLESFDADCGFVDEGAAHLFVFLVGHFGFVEAGGRAGARDDAVSGGFLLAAPLLVYVDFPHDFL